MLKGIIILASIPLLVWSLKVAADKSEIAECLKWKEQAGVIIGFYLSPAERAQCDFHNIKI